MKKSKALLSIFLVVWMIVLLCVASFAWIQRSWSPSLYHDNISITTAGSLVMQLASDNTTFTTLNMAEQLPGFSFRQVSSSNAVDFFAANFTADSPYYYPSTDRYMDFTFYLKMQSSDGGQEPARSVFIHPKSWISTIEGNDSGTPCASKAIRIAITDADTQQLIAIIGRNGDTMYADYGYNDTTFAAKPDANGKDVFSNYQTREFNPISSIKTGYYGLHYYNGGRTEFDPNAKPQDTYDFELDTSRDLFEIQAGQTKAINIKIWLEGGDENNCRDSISSDKLNILLQFDAKEIG